MRELEVRVVKAVVARPGTGSGGGFGILKANFLSEAGGFHAEEAALTPAVGGEIFDETFFDGGEFFTQGVRDGRCDSAIV